MSLNIIIFGLGQVGKYLARVLANENHNVVAIESNSHLCQEARESLDIQVIHGYATDSRLLETAGIRSTDMVIALTGFDELNILTCQMAARYGVQRKIARIRNLGFFEHKPYFTLKDWSVDIAIQPELETAKEIVLLIKRSAATDVLEFAGGKLQLIGIRLDTDSPVLNKTMLEVGQQHPDMTFRVVAILRNNRTIIPTGKDYYLRRDQVFVLARTDDIPRVVQLMGKSEEKLEKIMMLGGGKIGRAVAKLLEK